MFPDLHLAQVNISRMRAALDDPLMAGFVGRLAEINAVADSSPGFVWRLQAETGDATYLQPYEDPFIIMNLSVWESVEALHRYAYRSSHAQMIRGRDHWFVRMDQAYVALWWVPAGHIPTIEEAKERLDHLRVHGESPAAFSIKRPFPPLAVAIPAGDFEILTASAINYDQRVFQLKANSANGDCGEDVIFQYRQAGRQVWATYEGRGVRLGTLAATADQAGCLDSLYQHLNRNGQNRLGQCRTVPEILPDGRLRLHESWKWVGSNQPDEHTVLEELISSQSA